MQTADSVLSFCEDKKNIPAYTGGKVPPIMLDKDQIFC